MKNKNFDYELCKVIGNHYGVFLEVEDGYIIDNYDEVFKYSTTSELLKDWLETLMLETNNGGSDWSEEIKYITENIK